MLVAPLEQLRSRYEWFGLVSQFEGNLIDSRFVGMCVLHRFVGTILPSGPREAIASFGSSEGGTGDCVDRIAYLGDLRAGGRWLGNSWMLTSAFTQCVSFERCSRLHA